MRLYRSITLVIGAALTAAVCAGCTAPSGNDKETGSAALAQQMEVEIADTAVNDAARGEEDSSADTSTDAAIAADSAADETTVGEFSTEDIFGTSYTQDMFKDYDITLVNCFATWCPPCIAELPELEKLREYYEENGVKVGITAVALDVKNPDYIEEGIDEDALESAKLLYEESNASFPFLISDDGGMNGRLKGISAVPESFFVDKDGNIVGDTYSGARDMQDWANIVAKELKAIEQQ